MAFDRRREKSFGEPTRVRTDGTAGSTKDGDLPKKPANTAYERYKQELHAFFNGEKPLPDHLKDMLATRPGAADHGLADEAAEAEAKADATKAQALAKTKAKETNGKPDKAPRRVINGPSDDVLAPESLFGVEFIAVSNGVRCRRIQFCQPSQPATLSSTTHNSHANTSDAACRDSLSGGNCNDFTRSLRDAEDDFGPRASVANESDTWCAFMRTRRSRVGKTDTN